MCNFVYIMYFTIYDKFLHLSLVLVLHCSLTSLLASASDLLVPCYVTIIIIIIILLSLLFLQVKENKAMSLSLCYWG